FDALSLARERGTEVNAILLGALAGSGALPVGVQAFRKAIESRGVQVAANLKGFDVGLETAKNAEGGAHSADEGVWGKPTGSPSSIDLDGLPDSIRAVVEHALARLVDYQDAAYARRYLARLRPFTACERVGAVVARHLATWMMYEDAIRVAQAKTRAARFARIRGETRAGDAVIEVTDYLKPDLDEIWGILPHRLVSPFARWAERRWPHGRPTLGQHVRTTTVSGYLRVWLLARLRALRPVSWRAHAEHGRIDRWLGAVERDARGGAGGGRQRARGRRRPGRPPHARDTVSCRHRVTPVRAPAPPAHSSSGGRLGGGRRGPLRCSSAGFARAILGAAR